MKLLRLAGSLFGAMYGSQFYDGFTKERFCIDTIPKFYLDASMCATFVVIGGAGGYCVAPISVPYVFLRNILNPMALSNFLDGYLDRPRRNFPYLKRWNFEITRI